MKYRLQLRLPKKGLNAVMPLAFVAVGGTQAVQTSDRLGMALADVADFSMTQEAALGDIGEVFATSTVVTVRPVGEDQWDDQQEEEFLALAKKEALGTIFADEAERLEALSETRSMLKHRRSLDDLIFYAKQEQARAELIEAMGRFLSTYNKPRWKGAKRNK